MSTLSLHSCCLLPAEIYRLFFRLFFSSNLMIALPWKTV